MIEITLTIEDKRDGREDKITSKATLTPQLLRITPVADLVQDHLAVMQEDMVGAIERKGRLKA